MLDDYPKEVELQDGENAMVRIATREDETRLVLFFLSISEDERDFVPYDMSERENLQGWFGGPNWEDAFPLIAEINGRIVAVAMLKGYRARWHQHVGDAWLLVHENSRGIGLGRILANELFSMASDLGILTLKSEIRADAVGSIEIFKRVGFDQEGALKDYIKDSEGNIHDLAILSCDVQHYFRLLTERKGNVENVINLNI